MAYPIDVGTIALYRGDTRSLPFEFHAAPALWAPGVDYVAGNVGSAEYLANSSATYLNQRYTCTIPHTSGATFDISKWTLDSSAVGPLSDLTAFGTVVTCEVRKKPDDASPITTLSTFASDLQNGVLEVFISADDWNKLATFKVLGFDVEVATVDRSSVTTLLSGMFEIAKDYTHDTYGS